MELGVIQKAWIKSLRENPERQIDGILGRKDDDSDENEYQACCLGELLCVKARLENKPLPFDEHGCIRDTADTKDFSYFAPNLHELEHSYKELGLYSAEGDINCDDLKGFSDLAGANDNGIKWFEIANFIEANPEKVFTKSV